MKLLQILFFLLLSFSAFAQGIITTVAGGGSGGSGVPATQAGLTGPNDVLVDDTGNIYIAENYLLWKVDKATGIINIIGGDGNPGVGGDGIHISQARFGGATALAFDKQGNLYIADAGNHVIRKMDRTTGILTKVVGDWTLGYSGDGGPANNARMKYPQDIAFDTAGNLFIADLEFVIRKVDAQTGIITTIAGNGIQGTWNNGDTAKKAQLGTLSGICVDLSGVIYFSDANSFKIAKINQQGILSTYCGSGSFGVAGDGGLAVDAETFAGTKITMDKGGNMYFGDPGRIRKIDASSGIITKIAGNGFSAFSGDGGSALNAGLSAMSTCFDVSGNLFLADKTNLRVRRITGVVGVENISHITDFVLYPNPSNGILFIKSTKEIKQVQIRSISGQFVYQSLPNNHQTQIDISAHPSGVYVVSVIGESWMNSKKVVIHH